MNALWSVAAFEYLRHLRKKRFLWAVLSMPLMILFIVGMVFVMAWFSVPKRPIGYVAPPGLLQADDFYEDALPALLQVPFRPYADEARARQALDAGEIAAYVLLPADYPAHTDVRLVYYRYPGDQVQSALESALRRSLLRQVPPDRRELAKQLAVTEVVPWRMRGLNSGREKKLQDIGLQLVPIAGGFLLLLLSFISSGYLLAAVLDEKVNYTVEVLATTVSPFRLLAGKLVGITGLALTQLAIWVGFAVGGWWGLRRIFPLLQHVHVSWRVLGIPLLFVAPAYLMLAGLLAALGAMVTAPDEAQQWTALITLPMMAPIYLIGPLMASPNSPLAIGLSLFPITAPLTMLIRYGAGTIPLWQIVLSQAIAWAGGLGAVWFSGYVFRLGMLRYGKRLRLREVLFRRGGAV